MAVVGPILTVEALICGINLRVTRIYNAGDFSSFTALGRRLLADLVDIGALALDAAPNASVGFYNYAVLPSEANSVMHQDIAVAVGNGLSAKAAVNRRLDDQTPYAPLAVAARQIHDAHVLGSIAPVLARIVPAYESPRISVGLTLFSPGEEAQQAQMLVGMNTTVGDVRQFIRGSFDISFSRQRWLSLQHKSLQQRRSLDVPAAKHYDTTYDMLLDDSRTLNSYGGAFRGVEIHAAIDPPAPPATPPVAVQQPPSRPKVEPAASATLLGAHPSDVSSCKATAEAGGWKGHEAQLSYTSPYFLPRAT